VREAEGGDAAARGDGGAGCAALGGGGMASNPPPPEGRAFGGAARDGRDDEGPAPRVDRAGVLITCANSSSSPSESLILSSLSLFVRACGSQTKAVALRRDTRGKRRTEDAPEESDRAQHMEA
jgi:hypothetical protein